MKSIPQKIRENKTDDFAALTEEFKDVAAEYKRLKKAYASAYHKAWVAAHPDYRERKNAAAREYQRKKQINNKPHIPWRSVVNIGLPKLVEAEICGDEEISRYESEPCLVYLKNVDEDYLEYEIAQYIKSEYTDGTIEGHWFELTNGTEVENVTHWSCLPKPPKEDDTK